MPATFRAASKPRRAPFIARWLNYTAIGIPRRQSPFPAGGLLNPGPEKLREDPRVDHGVFLFRQSRLTGAAAGSDRLNYDQGAGGYRFAVRVSSRHVFRGSLRAASEAHLSCSFRSRNSENGL